MKAGQLGGWGSWNPGKSSRTVASGLPLLCWEAASLPGIGSGAGGREACGGAKQAGGWVPTSRASLGGGGWGTLGSGAGSTETAPKGPSAELWRFVAFQALPGDPLDTSFPAFQGPPGLAVSRALLALLPSPLPASPVLGPLGCTRAGLPSSGDKSSGSGRIYRRSFLLLPVICPPTPGRF